MMSSIDDTMKSSVFSSMDYILSTKSLSWENEQEIRYVKALEKNSKRTLSIKIHRVILGIKTPLDDERLIRKVVETINASQPKDKHIVVIRLKRDDIDFGFVK